MKDLLISAFGLFFFVLKRTYRVSSVCTHSSALVLYTCIAVNGVSFVCRVFVCFFLCFRIDLLSIFLLYSLLLVCGDKVCETSGTTLIKQRQLRR